MFVCTLDCRSMDFLKNCISSKPYLLRPKLHIGQESLVSATPKFAIIKIIKIVWLTGQMYLCAVAKLQMLMTKTLRGSFETHETLTLAVEGYARNEKA